MLKRLLFALIFVVGVMLLSAGKALAQERPNVLLITTDDLRADLPGFAGGPAKTPNLDRLRGSSVYFANAMTTTGLCSPARAALFTGRWGHRTGVDDNVRVWHSRNTGLDVQQSTIMEWTRSDDYLTGFVGKWHLGGDGPFRREKEAGYYGISNRRPDFDRVKRYYDMDNTPKEKPRYYAVRGETYEDTEASRKVARGITFLRDATEVDKPFFLALNFNAPHPPYQPPAEYVEMYDYREVGLPASLDDPFKNKPLYQKAIMWPWHDVGHMSHDDWRKTIAYAQADLSVIDHGVGKLLDAVRANGFWENTIIIFVSDQGSMLGEHGLYDKGPYSYDELMRIPLLVRIPNVNPKRISRQVSLIDVTKTLVDVMSLAPVQDPPVDSRTLMPLINHGNSAWEGPDEAFYRYEWYNGRWFGVRTIRTPRYKYSWNPAGPDEMYDLKKDPHEITNVVNKPSYREECKRLQQRLLQHLMETKDPFYDEMKSYLKVGGGGR